MFVLKRKEPVAASMQHLASQRCRRLIARLDPGNATPAALQPDVDRLRALVLLLHGCVPVDVFRRESHAVLRITRALRGPEPSQPLTPAVHRRLQALLQEALMRTAYWPIGAAHISDLGTGLRRTYGSASRACASPTFRAHVAGEQLAALGQQLTLLRRGWPVGVQPHRKLCASLARRARKHAAIDDRFTRDAHRLFQETPARFAQRIMGYWAAELEPRTREERGEESSAT